MNVHKTFNLAMAFVFAFSLFGMPAPVSAQEYNPSISVIYNQDSVALWGWTPGIEVTLTIDNPANGTGIDYSTSMTMDNASPVFYIGPAFDIQVGDVVKVTDGITIKQVTVTDVRILGANLDTDTVYGKTDPSDTITVFAYKTCDFQGQVVTADQNGNWVADFTGICNIIGSTTIMVTERDEDSDTNAFVFDVPTFSVQPQNNRVSSIGWIVGNEVMLTIDNPANGVGVDFTDTKTVVQYDWWSYLNNIDFDLGTFETHPGDLVTMTDGITTKETVVANLALGGGNPITDRVWGTADPGTVIQVRYRDDYSVFRNVIADIEGNWMADFSVPGDDPGEEAPFDIESGNVMLVNQNDEDGDQTQLDFRVPNPHIEASPEAGSAGDWVRAYEWPNGTIVTMTIDNSTNGVGLDYTATATMGPAPWYLGGANNIVADFDLQGYDIRAGDVITVSGNGTTKTLTIFQLAVTGFDFDLVADTISGTGTAGLQFQVCAKKPPDDRCITRWVTPDENGKWTANYQKLGTGNDTPDIFDVQPGSKGWVAKSDEDGDLIKDDWHVPTPYILAAPNQYFVYALDWPNGTVIHMTIARSGSTIYTSDATVGPGPGNPGDPIHSPDVVAYFDLSNPRFDLQPGDVITLTGGGITKSMTVSALQITDVDVNTDTVSGIADAGRDVQVDVCDAPNLMVTPRSDGHWTANFAPFDILPGECGGARQTDANGNVTFQGWTLEAPPTQPCQPGDTVTGYVYGPDGITPLSGDVIHFDDYDSDEPLFVTTADSGGSYQCALPEGSYRIWADNYFYYDDSGSVTVYRPSYSRQYYPDAIYENAGRVIVQADTQMSHVDFSLQVPTIAYEQLVFDLSDPILSDLAVRQAIAFGTNRQAMIDVAAPGAPLLDSFIPQGFWSHGSGLPQYNYDPQHARELLDAVSWLVNPSDGIREKNGQRLVIDFHCNTHFPDRPITANMFKADMKAIGIGVNVDTTGNHVGTHSFGISMFAWVTDANADFGEGGWWWAFKSDRTDTNFGLYNNPIVDGLLETIRPLRTRAEVLPLATQVQMEVMTDLATLPLFSRMLPPVANAGADSLALEGQSLTLDGSQSTDAYNDITRYEWDLDGDGIYDDASGATPAVSFAENGVYIVSLKVVDAYGLTSTDTVTITVANVPPSVRTISAPVSPVQIGTTINASANFTDPGTADTFTATWTWDDGTTSPGMVTNHSVTGSHQYTIPGVYILELTVTDDDGGIGSATYQYVVVYDPTGGFVTGGGWFTDPTTGSKAHFGFNPKYQKDSTIPKGETEFSLGGLKFKSTSHEWMTINGAKAQFKGSGTINGAGNYGFLVTVIDGQVTGGGGLDKVRIKIWNKSTGEVIYDNQPDTPETADPVMRDEGGSIVIHSK